MSQPKSASPNLDHFRTRLRQLRQDLDAAWPLDRGRLADEIHGFEVILEEVQVAEEELLLQNEELVRAQESFETERLRFLNLFEFAPDACLVTDLAGVMREANKAASDLLATSRKALGGKPLAVYVADDERPAFRATLSRGNNRCRHQRSRQCRSSPKPVRRRQQNRGFRGPLRRCGLAYRVPLDIRQRTRDQHNGRNHRRRQSDCRIQAAHHAGSSHIEAVERCLG